MGLRAERVEYGRAAARALHAQVAATKREDALAPVTVVVPSNHVAVATRRLLASGVFGGVGGGGNGLIAVDFLTPFRLAELQAAARLAALGRRPVSSPVIAAAMRGALSEDPGLFEPVRSHPATEEALVRSYRELRDLPDADLDALARRSARAGDVVRLHRAARAALSGSWYDEEDLTDEASAVLTREPGTLGTIVVYLPQLLTRHMAGMLRAAGEHHDVRVLAGCTGHPDADADVSLSLRRLGLRVEEVAEERGPYSSSVTRILTASDPDEEVRAAVRAVVDAMRSGTRLDRIAVLHASPEPYGRILHEQLAAADIRVNGAAVVPVKERVAARVLLRMIELPDRDFSRRDVLAWINAIPFKDRDKRASVSTWERLSREAGIIGGLDQWSNRLERDAEHLDDVAARLEVQPDGGDNWARRDARRARDLRDLVLTVGARLQEASTPRRWSAHVDWARGLLDDLVGSIGEIDARWDPVEAKAAERLHRALDRLSSLDAVEGEVTLETFTRTLVLELDADLGRVGRLGDGVLIGGIGLGIGLDLDLLVVLGLAEGSFPTLVREDSLLSDAERSDALPLRRENVGRQHRQLLASVSSASRQVLSVPRGDLRRSTGRMPSRWVLDAASELAGHRFGSRELLRTRAEWAVQVPSFIAGLRSSPFPATEQELRLKALMSGTGAAHDHVYDAGVEMIRARRSDRFTRFDGNLAGLLIDYPTVSSMSATGLESWVACPMAHLFTNVLRVREVEEREENVRILAKDRGTLVHAVLERFVAEGMERGGLWNEDDRARMRKIGDELCTIFEELGLTGQALYWEHDRKDILADLDRFVTEDSTRNREDRSRPVAVEFAFGDPPAVIVLADGRTISFKGKIDRLDLDADRKLRVVDYKTGANVEDFKNLTTDNPDNGGRHLQLVIYGIAARGWADTAAGDGLPTPDAVSAHYWMVSDRGMWRRYGYEITDGVVAHVTETVRRIVDGMEKGVFPAHPTRGSSSPVRACAVCDIDGLGEADLQRSWLRKKDDPAMAPYVSLLEAAGG
jgi:ATP-dependent helicase/nuclease subunit B